MYICHILITWARFLWSRPQSTNHVVLVKQKIARMREPKWSRVWPGGDRRVKRLCESRMEQEQSKQDCARERRRKQRNIASEESKAKEKRVWQILTRYFAHFLKLFRPLLCHLQCYISSPTPRTNTLHAVTTDIYLHISSARGILGICIFLVVCSMSWWMSALELALCHVDFRSPRLTCWIVQKMWIERLRRCVFIAPYTLGVIHGWFNDQYFGGCIYISNRYSNACSCFWTLQSCIPELSLATCWQERLSTVCTSGIIMSSCWTNH